MRTTKLTDRQIEIVELIAEGFSDAEIGRLLGVKATTIKKQCELIAERFGIEPGAPGNRQRRVKIIQIAWDLGYIN